jgi:hypothetical protein
MGRMGQGSVLAGGMPQADVVPDVAICGPERLSQKASVAPGSSFRSDTRLSVVLPTEADAVSTGQAEELPEVGTRDPNISNGARQRKDHFCSVERLARWLGGPGLPSAREISRLTLGPGVRCPHRSRVSRKGL